MSFPHGPYNDALVINIFLVDSILKLMFCGNYIPTWIFKMHKVHISLYDSKKINICTQMWYALVQNPPEYNDICKCFVYWQCHIIALFECM